MSSHRSVVAVGGSAGGIEALLELVASLPVDLPAPVLVTVHVGDRARSKLPEILSRAGLLEASHARHGEPLRPGRIYVAPPDVHLLVGAGTVRLSSGPRVNRHRPAVDVMFAGLARWAGAGVVAVVLSGLLDDGAVGAALVARAGGHVIVQDPAEAAFDSMPRSALSAVPDARAVPTAQLAKAVCEQLELSSATDDDPEKGAQEMVETRMSDSDDPGYLTADEARLTRMSCPDCNGGLAEIQISHVRYYRCHVGHQYSPQSLEAAQREAAEAKLWAAAAALEEHAALARHLAHDPQATNSADYRQAADRSADTAKSLLSQLHRSGRQAE
jgi:two-component system, chemotaxis family, protein-glutamate methylesterase/glutaminase